MDLISIRVGVTYKIAETCPNPEIAGKGAEYQGNWNGFYSRMARMAVLNDDGTLGKVWHVPYAQIERI